MKNLIASAFIAFLAVGTAQVNAQTAASKVEKREHHTEKKEARKALRKLEGKEVNQMSKDNFAGDFTDASNVSWTRGRQFDEATFTSDGKNLTAYYDFNSKLVGTTSTKTFNDLPEAAQKEINKHYKGYNIGPVIEFDDNEDNDTDMLYYGTQFEDTDHYFVTVSKGGKESVLMVGMNGEVSLFKEIK